MAQGFITSCDKNPEDVGHEYFMDLLWRSFFQEVKEDDFGNISLLTLEREAQRNRENNLCIEYSE